jgi:glutaredoxin
MDAAFRGDRVRRFAAILLVMLAAVVLGAGAVGCHKASAGVSADPAATSPIVLKPDSTGLLLTWVDDKGDFHVEDKVADVPLMGRDAVRVVDPNLEDGTHPDRVFIADLRTLGPDGSYPVRVATRAEFDQLALNRRAEKGPTLASGAPSMGPPPPGSAVAGNALPPSGNAPPPSGNNPVIIYGAEWCGPCHEVQSYLRSKRVPFVDKDIEKDRDAAREMQAKLAKAGRSGGSIPVIDVHGKILVGFNPGAVDAALGQAM